MTGQSLLDIFNNLTDESIDSDEALTLFNIVKDIIEADRPWRMLIKEYSSLTMGTSDTYLTAKSLPSDFLYETKVLLGIQADNSYYEYDPVSFEERRLHYGFSSKYCIDFANLNLYILGTPAKTMTIYLYYIYSTPDLTLSTSPVWPEKFHRIIPLLASEIWKAGVDIDTIELQGALQMSKQGGMLFHSMEKWDTMLKLKSMNNATPIRSKRATEELRVI